MRFNIVAILGVMLAVSACDPVGSRQDEHLIGQKLSEVSSMTTKSGQPQNSVAIYDPTVSRVHLFDLAANILSRSFAVQNPGVEHYVLYDESANYVVDFSTKHMSIFDKDNQAQHNLLPFTGTPKSAAFRPAVNLLVMYDDKNSVGVLKIDGNGQVQKSKTFTGSILGVTISAGDMDESGRLIAALSDGKIAIIDLNASLNTGSWVVSATVNTSLTNPVWVAPVRGSPDLVLVQQDTKISLVNLATAVVTDGPSYSPSRVMFYGRTPDSHVIYYNPNDTSIMNLVFVKAGAIENRQVNFAPRSILNSHLDLTLETWNIVASKNAVYNSKTRKTEYNNRNFTKYRFDANGFVALMDEKLPDTARFEMSPSRLFAMLPVKMGEAVNYNLTNFTKRPLPHFNMPFIDRR